MVIVFTLQQMGGSVSYETSRRKLNTLLRADFPTTTAYTNILTGASYADYLVDLGNDATLGVAGERKNDLTYYQSDSLWTNAGYAIVAALLKCVSAFIALTRPPGWGSNRAKTGVGARYGRSPNSHHFFLTLLLPRFVHRGECDGCWRRWHNHQPDSVQPVQYWLGSDNHGRWSTARQRR